MRLYLIAVGKTKKGPENALYEHFIARLGWSLELREVEEKRPIEGERRKVREGELLRAAIPDGVTVVALDERGGDLPSRKLAERIGLWRDEGRDIAFLIGGADGLDPALRQSADLIIRFGRATWPHMLVRGMLAEQLYRCQQILAGHPYHRD